MSVNLPQEDRPIIRPKLDNNEVDDSKESADRLRSAEENPQSYNDSSSDTLSDGSISGNGNENSAVADQSSTSQSGSSSEKGKEKNAGHNEDGGLFKDESNDPKTRIGKFRQGAQNLKGKVLENKLMWGLGASGGGLIILLILFFAFALGGYKVVHFAEHIAVYQFARTTRMSAQAAGAINENKIAISALAKDDGAYSRMKSALEAKKNAANTKTTELLSKFDNYRPNKVIKNFQASGTIKFNEAKTAFGRTYYKSVTIDGKTVDLETKSLSSSTKQLLVPGYKLKTRDFNFSSNFAPDLIAAMKADGIGPITRAKVASQIRKELNISLSAWVAARYAGKTEEQAKAETEKTAYEKSKGGQAPDTEGLPDNFKDTADETEKSIDDAVNDPKQLDEIVNNPNEMPKNAKEVLRKALSSDAMLKTGGLLKEALGFINPLYNVAVPICLIYEGSLVNSGPAVKTQTQELQRSALYVQSAKSQMQNGYGADATAAGAISWKLGDITNTIPERRANGAKVDTTKYASPEASPLGSYSIADYALGEKLGGVVDSMANVCPALTNIWVGVGLGVVNLTAKAVITFATGGLATAPEVATETAAEQVAKSAVSRVITKIVEKSITAKAFASQFTKDTIKLGITVGGGTIIAHELVASHINANHSSLSVGEPYGNDSDAGFNIYTNQINNRQFYGAPLSDKELSQDNQENTTQLAKLESDKPAFERYLSINNSFSLISRLFMNSSGLFSGSLITTVKNFASSITHPTSLLAYSIQPVLNRSAIADTKITSANTYYGIVQFGYTSEEKALMQKPEYGPLENQKTLDESSKEDEISTIYGPCFDGTKDISAMLTEKIDVEGENHYIVRNDDGDVIGGLCAQDNVGPHNKNYGDLVFRWRLANNYNNMLDQLIDEQEITQNGEDSSGSAVSGDAQELAQQVLNNNKISLSGRLVREDVQAAAKDENGSADVKTSSVIFALLLEIAKNHTVTVSALQSGGTGHCHNTPKAQCPDNGHYNGDAIDFSSLDGKPLTGRDSGSVAIIGIAGKVLPKGTGIGQSNCGSTVNLPDGFNTFEDSCNHLHIQVPKGTP